MGSGHTSYWTDQLDQSQPCFVANAVRGTRGRGTPQPMPLRRCHTALPPGSAWSPRTTHHAQDRTTSRLPHRLTAVLAMLRYHQLTHNNNNPDALISPRTLTPHTTHTHTHTQAHDDRPPSRRGVWFCDPAAPRENCIPASYRDTLAGVCSVATSACLSVQSSHPLIPNRPGAHLV